MRAADTPPVADQIPESTNPDMSWIDITVLGQKRGVVIVDYAPGWSDFIDELHFADVFENEEPGHLDPGVYRWSGFKVGSWQEGDLCVVKGGTFTRAAPPAMDREAVVRECADALVAYCKGMNEAGKEPSFLDAHKAILRLSTLSADAICQWEGEAVQRARDAAADYLIAYSAWSEAEAQKVRNGHRDNLATVQAFVDLACSLATPASHASDGGKA